VTLRCLVCVSISTALAGETAISTHTLEQAVKRWLRFERQGVEGFGVFDEPSQTVAVHDGDLFNDARPTGKVFELSDLRVLTPTRPAKLIGLWNNFHELATKLGQSIPQEPLFFVKTSNSYLAPGGVIRRPAGYDGKVCYEGELGIVIGAVCRNVDEFGAASSIFGYTCVNDVTALDLISSDASFAQWVRAKSCDTFAPFGPVVATGLDWSSLRIRTLLNGRERQNYAAIDMILSPMRIVSLLSREMTLFPGDIIACGTSLGVLPMRLGMTVEVVIDGIGALHNTYESTQE
jgi:2-keto-4-pentenoate hydratase/2-oxohepta-3-ene-1,7-dioic acid hydratase in catechol pathway